MAYELGLTDRETAKKLGITQAAYTGWRTQRGLGKKRREPAPEPDPPKPEPVPDIPAQSFHLYRCRTCGSLHALQAGHPFVQLGHCDDSGPLERVTLTGVEPA